MFSDQEIEEANRRAQMTRDTEPYIVRAKYDAKLHRVILILNNNAWFSFSPADSEDLEHATAAQLRKFEVSPSGYGIHFPDIDADLSLEALLAGRLGSSAWMRQRRDHDAASASSEHAPQHKAAAS